MRRAIKIYHFTRFPEYFTGRDHFLLSQEVINAREKRSDLPGTNHATSKGKRMCVGCKTYCGFGLAVDFKKKFRSRLWSVNAFPHSGHHYLCVPYWHSRLPKEFGDCVCEMTVLWLLYALLTLCSSAAIDHRLFPLHKYSLSPLFIIC